MFCFRVTQIFDLSEKHSWVNGYDLSFIPCVCHWSLLVIVFPTPWDNVFFKLGGFPIFFGSTHFLMGVFSREGGYVYLWQGLDLGFRRTVFRIVLEMAAKSQSFFPKNGAKQRVSMSGNDSDELEHSASGTREDASVSPAKSLGAKKRKRVNQDAEFEQANGGKQDSGDAGKKPSEIQHKVEQNPASAGNKSNGKQSSQNSDPQKEEYIHVRARRGQATYSHSLAERVRREKISERMKFLQDLVPGCSKVIGKAVMLDEIINYVQSLQRQVEDMT